MLEDERPGEAEALARAALEQATAALHNQTLATANFHRLLGDALYAQRRYAEAEPHFRAAYEMRQKELGDAHADTAVSAADLGYTLRNLGRLDEAEPLYRKALDARIAALGADAPETARSWQRLARLVDQRGDHLRAAGLMDEALAAGRRAFGPDEPMLVTWMGERAAMLHDGGEVEKAEAGYRAVLASAARGVVDTDGAVAATAMLGLANLLHAGGRGAEAEPYYRDAVAARERQNGPVHPSVASALEGWARLYEAQGRPADALPLYERALSIRDTTDGDFNAASAADLLRIGSVLNELDRAADAESAFRRALAIRETLDGPRAASVAEALRGLANAVRRLDRFAEAEAMQKRALEIAEASLPADHPYIGFDLLLLGTLYSSQQRFDEAKPLLERALGIMERNAASSAGVARAALAGLMFSTGDIDGAAALTEASLAELSANPDKARQAADTTVILAQIRLKQKRLAEAAELAAQAAQTYARIAPQSRAHVRTDTIRADAMLAVGKAQDALALYRSVLARLEATHGAGHVETASALWDVGKALLALGDLDGAAGALERSVAVTERVAAIDAATAFSSRTGAVEDRAVARAGVYDTLIRAYAGRQADGDVDKAFLTAQRVIESQAAQAVAQMTARQASGSGELSELARRRQDLVAEWRAADLKLNALLGAAQGKRDAAAADAVRARLAQADAAIAAIDTRLESEFPDFSDLQKAAPVDLDAVREKLAEDEVLLFYADVGGLGAQAAETHLWAVTRSSEPRWLRLLGTAAELRDAVRTLRELIGVAAVTRGATPMSGPESDDRTDRALDVAHRLYRTLLKPVADLVDGRRLIVVPSRRLASLPFHMLVETMPPADSADRNRDAGWLAKRHAITVLPSVAAIAATRPVQAASARTPYLGFANPALTGPSGRDQAGHDRVKCRNFEPPHGVTLVQPVPGLASLFRGGGADVDAVRRLEPLPETAEEACAVAAALGADPNSVRLARNATESEVRRLSKAGELARARIVHFATHGLVSGELAGLAEPAIVLTPPDAASPTDDGLLTASEVATLRLDADWVILSACNTAAGDGGGEALSGLARAFFYAGARSLMVSHWPVASEAAVRLATGAIAEIAADPAVGRDEALRRAMLAEIAAGGRRADPANWAPFVVVGAGS